MPRVVTQSDVDAVPPGGTLAVAALDTITPLARERAASRGVILARAGEVSEPDEEATRKTVRAVTRAVVGRLGDAGPEVIEAVVQEVLSALSANDSPNDRGAQATRKHSPAATLVTTPRGATLQMIKGEPPTVDHCAVCVEQERSRSHQRAVMTTTGRNQKGIVARVTARVAELGGDILDISQTLVGDYFTMIIVIDVGSLTAPFARFQDEMQSTCREMNCQVMIMHEDVMASLHRV